ncbi:MAG TPA: hypothetical protein VFA07_15250 [Chthonomonadaceae bacterium]|nr:hypothetical protein [Chthonomonadaceae bacterium]
MQTERHFIIFQRTTGHCANWLVRAPSIREAIILYVREELTGVGEGETFITSDGYGGKVVYTHPLECIEAEEKIWHGGKGWNGWEIRELTDQHWAARYAEVFCSENPYDVERYIAVCRPLLRARYPRSRARAFVWYLKEGPLVTFYRRKNPARRWPIEILVRYLLPWEDWPQVQEWSGSYDDILNLLNVEYLPPFKKFLELSS